MINISIAEEDINSSDATALIEELSRELGRITGDSGQSSFTNTDLDIPRSLFVIARENGEANGCGAFREISTDIAEIKRMYARKKSDGIGHKILHHLEEKAKELGYSKVILETRKCNERAVMFYLKNGYKVTINYGKYENLEESVCFEKYLC